MGAEPDSVAMASQARPEKLKKHLVNRPAVKFDHTVCLKFFQTWNYHSVVRNHLVVIGKVAKRFMNGNVSKLQKDLF